MRRFRIRQDREVDPTQVSYIAQLRMEDISIALSCPFSAFAFSLPSSSLTAC